MENEQPFETLLTEMYQAKVWSEVTEGFNSLSIEEQSQLLAEFALIVEDHGVGSQELHDYFHKQSMRFSKTYYFVNTLVIEEGSWDKALEELS